MRADEIPDDMLDQVVGEYWDFLGELNREGFARMGMEPGWWADKPDDQKRAEKQRFAVLLEIAWPHIARQILEEAADLVEPYSGIGLANAATRGDIAAWIRARASALASEGEADQ